MENIEVMVILLLLLCYGRNPSLMTEITFITTVASILTIPLITMLFR